MQTRDWYRRRREYQSVDFTCLPVRSLSFIVLRIFDSRREILCFVSIGSIRQFYKLHFRSVYFLFARIPLLLVIDRMKFHVKAIR